MQGIEHPNYQGRGYSKDIPTRLKERFEAALNDPNLISLQTEMALMDARLGEVLAKLPTGESGLAWDQLGTALANIKSALVDGREADAQWWLAQADKWMKHASSEASVWGECYAIIGQRRQLADTERKREEMLAGNMTTRQAMTFVAALQTAVMEEVSDDDTRRRIGLRIQFLLGMSGAPKDQHLPKDTIGGQRHGMRNALALPRGEEVEDMGDDDGA